MKKSYYLGLLLTLFFTHESFAQTKIMHMSVGRWGGGAIKVSLNRLEDGNFVARTVACNGKPLTQDEQEASQFGLAGDLEKKAAEAFSSHAVFAERIFLGEAPKGTGFELSVAYREGLKLMGLAHLSRPIILVSGRVSNFMDVLLEEARLRSASVCKING